MDCNSLIPNGSAKTICESDQITNLIFQKQDVSFDNYLDAMNSETWRISIQEELKSFPTLPIRQVAPVKPAENKESDGTGAEVTTRLNPGGGVVDLASNACDFNEMVKSMKGGYYRVPIGLGDNKVLLHEKKDGSLVGFLGQCTAIPTGMPGKDAKLTEYQISINWQYVSEFQSVRVVELPIDLNELVEFTPSAIDAKIKTKLSGTDMTVNLTARCTKDFETETLTGEILDTNVEDAAISVAAGSNGDYVVTLEKGSTPTALEAGDYINYRIVKETSPVYEKLSNVINGRLWSS